MNENSSPAVSVIVPVFNAEKYLGTCLECILAQTFQDFEVIVVDDCSTDNSISVAENFLERFDGRLKILSLEKNTGGGAVPRNIGLDFARGKYICFADADDFFIATTLKTFFDFAETFQAEVVYTEAGFLCGAESLPEVIYEDVWDKRLTVTEPTFVPDDFKWRVNMFCETFVRWPPWGKFLRRDFLVDNKITFPNMSVAEDGVWTFKVLCLAKKFLRVPTPLYVHRANIDSIVRRKRADADEIKFWLIPLLKGIKFLDEFMNRFEFFEQYPTWRLRVMNAFANLSYVQLSPLFNKLEAGELYKIFYEEFSKSNDDHAALLSYLMFIVNRYWNDLRSK